MWQSMRKHGDLRYQSKANRLGCAATFSASSSRIQLDRDNEQASRVHPKKLGPAPHPRLIARVMRQGGVEPADPSPFKPPHKHFFFGERTDVLFFQARLQVAHDKTGAVSLDCSKTAQAELGSGGRWSLLNGALQH